MVVLRILAVLSLLGLLSLISSCTPRNDEPQYPNVLILMLDTLRADHMGIYGYERNTTPELDKFARENLNFENMVSVSNWTPPSIASLFTGYYPTSHGMMPPNSRARARNMAGLAPNLETIAELLRKYGYQTAGVSSNPWITEEFGFHQGFGEYRYDARARAEVINQHGRELIDKMAQNAAPFLLYLHYLDPHDPYNPPEEYREMFKGPLKKSPYEYDQEMLDLITLYNGEIRYLDTELGKLFRYLKEKDLYDDMFIVIVGDHGEQFQEHGNLGHGFSLYNEEVRVPLMIKPARRSVRARTIPQTVSTVDIMPTIMDRIGVPVPPSYPGISLLDRRAIRNRAAVLSEIRRIHDLKSVTTSDGRRLVLSAPMDHSIDWDDARPRWKEPRVVGWFDSRGKDVAEKDPVTDPADTRVEELREHFNTLYGEALRQIITRISDEPAQIREETLDQLESLGYF